MHPIRAFALVAAVTLTPLNAACAQEEVDRSVAGGGISVPGWSGRVDARAAAQGQTVNDAKLAPSGAGLHVMTGPAVTYWNPANQAAGEYTVSATFREHAYMALNDHPHPYGIMIAGQGLDTEEPRYLYCAAYGNGRFIMRGFGPQPFQLNGRGEEHAAVNKAAAKGAPVTQEIAVTVRGDRVECAVNGTVVGSYAKSELLAPGRLTTTDGVYGIRFAHNTEADVTGLKVTPVVAK
jgi:hypothetical protein